MNHSPKRRTLLLAISTIPFISSCSLGKNNEYNIESFQKQLIQLEHDFNGRIGIFALDTADNRVLRYRAHERFPMCSTFKAIAVAAILARSQTDLDLMQQRMYYSQNELVTHSPVTEKHLKEGMTVYDLCDATMRYSDNTAANLLIKKLGSPAIVTAFARSTGDREFRLDRFETDLNTAIPGDLRDTSTPEAMGLSLQRFALGNTLDSKQRQQFQEWLLGSTTGITNIRAGIPIDWKIGDRTGAGDYGTRNAIAIAWPSDKPPIVIAIYTTQHKKDAKIRDDIVASAARIIVDWAKNCKGLANN